MLYYDPMLKLIKGKNSNSKNYFRILYIFLGFSEMKLSSFELFSDGIIIINSTFNNNYY